MAEVPLAPAAANGCPVSPPAPSIWRVPRAAPCWPLGRDFFPNTIGTTAVTLLPLPPIGQPPPSTGSTLCSAQTAVRVTPQTAHSPHPHRHERFPERQPGPNRTGAGKCAPSIFTLNLRFETSRSIRGTIRQP